MGSMAATKHKHATRESWLTEAVGLLWPMIEAEGYEEMPAFRISCGFPKGGRGKTMGQCWDDEASKDKHAEIFVSPSYDNAIDVLETVLHEMIHAVVGVKEGHKGPFRKLAKAVGFLPPMTSTPASEELKDKLAHLCGSLGPYPHAALRTLTRSKQSTRMLKLSCPNADGCGFICRATKTQIETVGVPTCACGQKLEQEEK